MVPIREELLAILERKTHSSWSRFTGGEVSREGIIEGYRQEWEVYQRDFPVLLARVLGKGPPRDVREHLAETIYEEQTGGCSRSAPHTELFLKLMAGLGAGAERFERVELLPEAARYRAFLDEVTHRGSWLEGHAVLGIFVEGTASERRQLERPAESPDDTTIEGWITRHPLVQRYGVGVDAMEAARVHMRLDVRRRHDAWRVLLAHLDTTARSEPTKARHVDETKVIRVVTEALDRWLAYRESIARECWR